MATGLVPASAGILSANQAAPVPPAEDHNHDEESKTEDKQEAKITVLSKEESKTLIKTKEFEAFINKTSKIVERALNTGIYGDAVSMFFDDDTEDDSKAMSMLKGDKITSMFTFQDNEPLKRAITSIEWSPKVCIYS